MKTQTANRSYWKSVAGWIVVMSLIITMQVNAVAQGFQFGTIGQGFQIPIFDLIPIPSCADIWFLDWMGKPGEQSFGSDINLGSRIVGASGSNYFSARPFIHGRFSIYTDLTQYVGGYGHANAINNANQVAGGLVNGTRNAFLATGYTSRDLGRLPGSSGSEAWGLNNYGHVVGTSVVGNTRHAFLWKPETGMLDLGPGDGADINDAGEVAGDGTFTYRYYNGVFTNLGAIPGFTSSDAQAINNAGHIVGESYTISLENHATLWLKGVSTPVDLSPNMNLTYAYDINNSNIIVGNAVIGGQERAMRWKFNPGNGTYTMTDLNNLVNVGPGNVLKRAQGINDSGQIVGVGIQNGIERAFILSPVNVKSLVYAANPVFSFSNVQARAYLTNAPSADVTLEVRDNHSGASAPSTITAYAGDPFANFNVSTYFVGSSTTGSFEVANPPQGPVYCGGAGASLTVQPLLRAFYYY